MGSRLIFLRQWMCDGSESLLSLLDWAVLVRVPGNSLHIMTVPQTDTGGLVEYTKALERTALKELGKLLP